MGMDLPDIYFIRHGETDWNREGRYQGSRDIQLNARGREQADANGPLLRELLERDGIDPTAADWIHSPLGRTAETMARVRAAFDSELPDAKPDSRLVEISFGDYEGQLHTDLQRTGIVPQGARDASFWSFMPRNGESYADVTARVQPLLAALKRPTVLVAHGGIARVVRVLSEGLDFASAVNWPAPQNAVLHFAKGLMTVHESDVPGFTAGVFAGAEKPS